MVVLVIAVLPLGLARLLAVGFGSVAVCVGAGVVEAVDHSFMSE